MPQGKNKTRSVSSREISKLFKNNSLQRSESHSTIKIVSIGGMYKENKNKEMNISENYEVTVNEDVCLFVVSLSQYHHCTWNVCGGRVGKTGNLSFYVIKFYIKRSKSRPEILECEPYIFQFWSLDYLSWGDESKVFYTNEDGIRLYFRAASVDCGRDMCSSLVYVLSHFPRLLQLDWGWSRPMNKFYLKQDDRPFWY